MNTDNNNNNNSSSSNGNRGKFSDRLKKMRRDRLKLMKGIPLVEVEEESIVKRGSRNILKIILAFPSVVYSVFGFNKKAASLNTSVESGPINELSYLEQAKIDKKLKINKIREIDVSLLKKQREIYLKEKKINEKEKDFYKEHRILLKQSKELEKKIKIEKLQKEIIDLIKKKLVVNINELEILQSELYLLKELNGEDIYLKKYQDDIKEIKRKI